MKRCRECGRKTGHAFDCINAKPKQWRKKFAWIPREIRGTRVWLMHYAYKDGVCEFVEIIGREQKKKQKANSNED